MSSDDDIPLIQLKRQKIVKSKGNLATRQPLVKDPLDNSDSDDDAPLAPLPIQKRKGRIAKPYLSESEFNDEETSKHRKQRKQRAQSKKKAVPKTPKKRNTVKEEDAEEEDSSKVILNFKEGQRHLCPPMGDGTRAFYESLLKERPHSVVANKYCIEHGLLIGTQHKENWVKYQQLRDLGAFKGAVGGVRLRFKDGISEDDLNEWKSVKGIKPSARKTTSSPKKVESKRSK